MLDNFKCYKSVGGLTIDKGTSDFYGNVDGLSLQNLYIAENGIFPGVFMFADDNNETDYEFDVKKVSKWIRENTPEDEELSITPYYTKVLSEKKEETKLGINVRMRKSKIYARIEKSAEESYILFDNEHVEEVEQFVEGILQFCEIPNIERNTFFRLCHSMSGYYLEKGKVKVPENFIVEKLYNDDFIKEDKKITEFIKADDKSGLILLHGEKGTGKSTYLKYLINSNPDKKFVYVPANLVCLLGDTEFGSFLSTLSNHIIILEDCENAIKNRKAEFGSSSAGVSLLLNMTDGLLADDLSIKFICTFNSDMKDIDSALLRKGRLISKYEFKPLAIEKAESILKERGIEAKLSKPLTLADVFYYEEDSYEVAKKSII